MTSVNIYRDKNKNIVKFIAEGHANASDENDIVCAAISSVTHLTLNGIENVLNISVGYEVDDGYLFFVLDSDITEEERKNVNILLDSMYLFLVNLEEQYSDNITICELEV